MLIVAVVLGLTALGAEAAGNRWMIGLEGMVRSGQTQGEDTNWGMELTASYRVNLGKIFFVRPYVGASVQRLDDDALISGPVSPDDTNTRAVEYDYSTVWNAVVGGDLGARIIAGLDIHTGPVVTFPFESKYPVRASWRFGLGYTIWKFYVSAAFEKRMTKPDFNYDEYPNWVFGVHYMF